MNLHGEKLQRPKIEEGGRIVMVWLKPCDCAEDERRGPVGGVCGGCGGAIPKWDRQCECIGNFARCDLPAGHAGTHRNKYEEFIQVDVKKEGAR